MADTEILQLKFDNQKTFNEEGYVPGYIECQTQCSLREGVCGAWSFDAVNQVCYLHNIDACCGQRGKQEEDLAFISGYNCPCCWSTYNECPCDLNERQCSSDTTAHASGAAYRVRTHTSAAILSTTRVKENKDRCKCVNVLSPRRRWK